MVGATLSAARNKRRIMLLGLLFPLFYGPTSTAGIIELSADGSFSQNSYSKTAYNRTSTVAASIGYRFFSLTGIEASYSQSRENKIQENIGYYLGTDSDGVDYVLDKINQQTDFQVYSISLVQNLFGRDAPIQPFIRLGVGYIIQESSTTATLTDGRAIPGTPSHVESTSGNVGLGFKILLTQHFALKFGGTIYATGMDKQDPLTHYTATAGLAILF